MTVLDGYQQEDARICMTLSGMAYAGSKKDLRKLLKDNSYATQGLWDLCWYGAQNENLLFVARQKKTGQLAIVIRGTVWKDLKNVFEDLDVLHTVNWMGGYISQGIYTGLQNLIHLEGEDGSTLLNYILQYLADVNPPQIFITGHSLGGALASVFALHLKTSIVYPANWSVYTFASPSVGDQGFVSYYNNEFSDGISSAYRIYNNCDLVPCAFASLEYALQQGIPVASEGIAYDVIKGVINGAQQQLNERGLQYMQVSTPVVLNNVGDIPAYLPPPPIWWPPHIGNWLAYQHGHQTYLELLGATPLPSTLAASGRPPMATSTELPLQ
ncbi:lipase family protein [Chitinophaga vietnamensis]|uniref:lipase family protein n=1 Tax=Chitinophaga vietnamensis TaxID=2593957 RepID=UPI0011788C29|nr:lipase family protein [Chitinophaga vietnamensis]